MHKKCNPYYLLEFIQGLLFQEDLHADHRWMGQAKEFFGSIDFEVSLM